jgi:Helix-turn-helix domain
MTISADAYFAIIPEWLLDSEVSDRAIRLYAILRRYADAAGTCFPSRTTLAARLRCSVDSVDRAVKELTTLEAVTVTGRIGSDGDQTSNLYIVHSLPEGGRKPAATPRRTGAATPPQACGPNYSQLTKANLNHDDTTQELINYSAGPVSEGQAPNDFKAQAEYLTAHVWWPNAKGKSTQGSTNVTKHIHQALTNGVSVEAVTAAILTLLAASEPIVDWRLGLAIEGKPRDRNLVPKGQLLADQKKDWTLLPRNANGEVIL